MFVPEISQRAFRCNYLKLIGYDRWIESCAASWLPKQKALLLNCMQGS